MREKVTLNQKRRCANWRTLEKRLALVERLTKLGHKFQSDQGHLNQKFARTGDRVILVTADLPMFMKGTLLEDMA